MVTTADPSLTFMTRDETAAFIRVQPQYLAKMAAKKRGPRFRKFGTAAKSPVRYALSDVLAWLENPSAVEAEVWGSRSDRNARRQRAGR